MITFGRLTLSMTLKRQCEGPTFWVTEIKDGHTGPRSIIKDTRSQKNRYFKLIIGKRELLFQLSHFQKFYIDST